MKHLKIEPQRWYYHCDRMKIGLWCSRKSADIHSGRRGTAPVKLYGYSAYKDRDSLNRAYAERMKKVKKLIPEGLCASVYTQWSDIEEEINGIYTYDREIRKIEVPDL